jgi:hypothetical protein
MLKLTLSTKQALNAEYKHAYPSFGPCVGVFSGFIVWCSLGGRGYSWYNLLLVLGILASFVEHVYLIRLNYMSV